MRRMTREKSRRYDARNRSDNGENTVPRAR
jgi:hypothetical protein